MKKLLFFTGVILIIASCKSNIPHASTDSTGAADSGKNKSQIVKAKQAPDDSISITLNGIDSAKADRMQKYYLENRGKDYKPTQKSVWFDKATIHHMVTLLNKERGLDKGDMTGKTDGIRIYFVSDPNIKTTPLNNSIIIVSTKEAGADTSAPSGFRHRDYYRHAANDSLFMDKTTIKGVESTRRKIFTNPGENLYHIYPGRIFETGDDSSCKDLHNITRGRANKMVNQWGRDTITTISEWFGIELLQAIDADTVHDGVRIYFTRHPVKYKRKPDMDANKEAFVMTTTLSRKTYHSDYFNCLPEAPFTHKKHPFLPAASPGGDDNGEICPNHCP